jgi:hypothetical protein
MKDAEYKEHEFIWLEPICDDCINNPRFWWQDDVWDACDECGRKPAKYRLVE